MLNNPDDTDFNGSGYTGFYDPDISQIVNFICQALIFSVGLFLHIKIIHESIVERNKTWMIQISHAVVITILWGFLSPFQALTHFVPNLSSHIGSWICYVGRFIIFYGYHEVLAHSLWVAIEKYILIVHAMKARVFGEERIEKIFCWIQLGFPFLFSIIAMATTDYDTRAEVKSCFGFPHNGLQHSNSSSPKEIKFLFCDVSNYSATNMITSHVVQFFCVSRALVNIVVATNLPEGFFYYKIFRKMHW